MHRRELMQTYFSRGDVEHRRIDAVTPQTLPTVHVRQPFTNSLAELAITTSHLSAIEAALRSGCDAAVIMEDDVRSRHLFDAAALIATAPQDWEILQLHVSNHTVVLELGEMYLRNGMLWHEWEPICFSAGAYVINRQGAQALLSRYRPAGRDVDLRGVHACGKLVADHLIYRRSRCYTATIPFFMNDVALASTHAPHRDDTHHRPGALGVESIMQHIEARLPMPSYPFALRTLQEQGNRT